MIDYKAIWLSLFMLISACHQTPLRLPENRIHYICPPVKEYPKSYQQNLSLALSQAEQKLDRQLSDILFETISDYKIIRDQARSCKQISKK